MAAYFISDIHLGARYHDDPLALERRVVAWLQSIDDVTELYLLGDIIDYWYEYRCVVPRGYTRFLGQLALMADRGVKVTWLTGNHDIWIRDYIPAETGCRVVDTDLRCEIQGKQFLLSHGDLIGDIPGSYRFMRGVFRNRFLQSLFSAVHPRWTIPFAHRWSSHSRSNGGQLTHSTIMNGVLEWAVDYQKTHTPVDYFITGHRHILVDETLPDGARFIILPDWSQAPHYARFDQGQLTSSKIK